MPTDHITAAEFEERLAALCASGTGSSFPRRYRDRQILFRSIVQSIKASDCSEPVLNEALQQWLADVGAGLDMDHVTLRRYLVDEGYLSRDAKGSAYQVCLSRNRHPEFEQTVLNIDSAEVVRAARQRAAERKQQRTQ